MREHIYDFTAYPVGVRLNQQSLRQRVLDDATITQEPRIRVQAQGDGTGNVVYTFAVDLTAPEVTALDALVAAHEHETLAELKTLCVDQCRYHRQKKLRSPEQGGKTVEYPAASGKVWSLSVEELSHWHSLYQHRNDLDYSGGGYKVHTYDGSAEHSFADATALANECKQIRQIVLADTAARDDAYKAIRAGDRAEAEAARDTYLLT